ncbi:hypothetical protein KY306_01050 [Candidatus Woesearchaeota archaeon]|nr:hypothetical protein [Candidatus Woesearchaeota archaeon]
MGVFQHQYMELKEKRKLIFCSISCDNFWGRGKISKFVIEQKGVPINPYMNWDYNLFHQASKESVRAANNSLIKWCNEVWAFGNLSDGVRAEILLAQELGKKVRFFTYPGFVENEIKVGKDYSHYTFKFRYGRQPVIYTAISKHYFYFKMFISKFVLDRGYCPANPFMIFDYWLLDAVDRKEIIESNNNMVNRAEELWVFGPVSDGVLAEINIAKEKNKPVKYFKFDSSTIKEIGKEEIEFEDEVKVFSNEI